MTVKKSGSPATKRIQQHDHRIVLPIDDQRNNPKFRREHPNVVFEGKKKPKVVHPKKHHPAVKHRKDTKAHHVVAKKKPTGQPAPRTPDVPLDPTITELVDGPDISEAIADDAEEGGESFLFNELVDESFDLDMDDALYNGATAIPSGFLDGVNTTDTAPNLTPPENLSVANVTLEAQVNAQDGNATYAGTLLFTSTGFDEDYEIRIMKQ